MNKLVEIPEICRAFASSNHPLNGMLQVIERDDMWPDYAYAFMMPADYSEQAGVRYRRYAHLGVKSKQGDAVMSAIGEAIERYCAVVYPLPSFRTSFSSIAGRAIPFENLIFYAREQYDSGSLGFSRPNLTSALTWVEAECLTDGQTCYVPQDLVLLHNEHSEVLLPSSNGLAFYTDRQQAALKGLLEVVERDARTLSWLARLAPTMIRPDTSILEQLSAFAHLDRDFYLLDISLDIPLPCVACISRQRHSLWPVWVASSACHTEPDKAIAAALAEHAETLVIITHLMPTEKPKPHDQQRYHLWYAASQLGQADMGFLLNPKRELGAQQWRDRYSPDRISDLESVVELMDTLGHKVLVIDLSTDDIKEFGFHVVRAICPGLQPLHFGMEYRCLGTSRLRGFLTSDTVLNRHPHPYA